jgi:hypothetical protein
MPRGRVTKVRRNMVRGGTKYLYFTNKAKPMHRYNYWLSKIKEMDIDLYNDMKNKPPRDNIQAMHTVFNDCKISKDLIELSHML